MISSKVCLDYVLQVELHYYSSNVCEPILDLGQKSVYIFVRSERDSSDCSLVCRGLLLCDSAQTIRPDGSMHTIIEYTQCVVYTTCGTRVIIYFTLAQSTFFLPRDPPDKQPQPRTTRSFLFGSPSIYDCR